MNALILAAVLAVGSGGAAPLAAPRPDACPTGCVEGSCWVLVLRYTVNEADAGQPPDLITKETFTAENYPSEEAAYCAAERIRQRGTRLPTLGRFGRDSNVIPESITPMPAI